MAARNRTRPKPTSHPSKRVAIYARRSKEDRDKTASLPEQIGACRRYVQERGWGEIVRVEGENRSGVSGFDRPVFQRLIKAAEGGAFEVLLTLDMSRFGRFDADERGYWVTRLRAAGVEVRHVMDDDRLAGEAGPIMGAVLQTGQREHSVKTAYKVTLGALGAIKRGFWPGGGVPLGYRLERRADFDGTGKRDATVKVVPEAAALVRRIFQLRIEYGLGYKTIARRLNDDDKRTQRGSLWTATSIKSILDNPAYKGDLVRGRKGFKSKFYVGNENGPEAIGDPGAKVGYEIKDYFPVIIDRETWDAAQRVARDRRKKFGTGGRKTADWGRCVLTEFAVCGACGGSAIIAEGSTGKKHRYSYMVCAAKTRGAAPTEKCRLVRAQENALTRRVFEEVRRLAEQIDPAQVAERVRARFNEADDPGVDLKELEKQRAKLARKRRELLLSDNEFVREGLEVLAEEDARLARELEVARRKQQAVPFDLEEEVQSAVSAALAITSPPDPGARDALRATLRSFIREIRIMPSPLRKAKHVELTLLTPEGLAGVVIGEGTSSTRSATPCQRDNYSGNHGTMAIELRATQLRSR